MGMPRNKIRTYMVAVLADKNTRSHSMFSAPISTLDPVLSLKSGNEIPIEERNPREVTHIKEHQLAPDGIAVHNPAFDVTPHHLIAAIITDRGVARAPYEESLRALSDVKEVREAAS